MTTIVPVTALPLHRFETTAILKKVASAGRVLAELKGAARAMPRQEILINMLGAQEARDSSAIENIITTHDDLYRDDLLSDTQSTPAAREVRRYRQALRTGFASVGKSGLLTLNHILQVQAELMQSSSGYRTMPGTELRDATGRTVYVPPQDRADIVALMSDLERFVNEPGVFDADPLVKMALIHHQFESIHPFYDGNGRTGRILNVLYLVKEGLLDIPVLYLSRYIVRTKADYYRLLQAVRDDDAWEEWVLYMLTGVEETASDALAKIAAIKGALMKMKHSIRERHKFYSQDLINNLFSHPYTKVEFVQQDLRVSRQTATSYLEALCVGGFLRKQKVGQTNFFINHELYAILTGESSSGEGA